MDNLLARIDAALVLYREWVPDPQDQQSAAGLLAACRQRILDHDARIEELVHQAKEEIQRLTGELREAHHLLEQAYADRDSLSRGHAFLAAELERVNPRPKTADKYNRREQLQAEITSFRAPPPNTPDER